MILPGADQFHPAVPVPDALPPVLAGKYIEPGDFLLSTARLRQDGIDPLAVFGDKHQVQSLPIAQGITIGGQVIGAYPAVGGNLGVEGIWKENTKIRFRKVVSVRLHVILTNTG
ncbi:hypothetical protein [Cyclobacterium plantarum]|uniref:hypothetical protein n=1 Tax=Cyclobacterium plantarum TaxID=2716263 RepID=UPI003F71BB1D